MATIASNTVRLLKGTASGTLSNGTLVNVPKTKLGGYLMAVARLNPNLTDTGNAGKGAIIAQLSAGRGQPQRVTFHTTGNVRFEGDVRVVKIEEITKEDFDAWDVLVKEHAEASAAEPEADKGPEL